MGKKPYCSDNRSARLIALGCKLLGQQLSNKRNLAGVPEYVSCKSLAEHYMDMHEGLDMAAAKVKASRDIREIEQVFGLRREKMPNGEQRLQLGMRFEEPGAFPAFLAHWLGWLREHRKSAHNRQLEIMLRYLQLLRERLDRGETVFQGREIVAPVKEELGRRDWDDVKNAFRSLVNHEEVACFLSLSAPESDFDEEETSELDEAFEMIADHQPLIARRRLPGAGKAPVPLAVFGKKPGSEMALALSTLPPGEQAIARRLARAAQNRRTCRNTADGRRFTVRELLLLPEQETIAARIRWRDSGEEESLPITCFNVGYHQKTTSS